MKSNISKESTITKYKEGEIVLVKAYGYPWWPCEIVEVFMDMAEPYTVLFLNDNKHAYVKESQIKPFSAATETPNHVKRNLTKNSKKLIEAYQEARKILGGKQKDTSKIKKSTNSEACPLSISKSLELEKFDKEKKFLKNKRKRNKQSRCEIIHLESNDEDTNEESTQEEILENNKMKLNKKGAKKPWSSENNKNPDNTSNEIKTQPTSFSQNAINLEKEIEILSKAHKSILECLNQIKCYVNPNGEKILRSPEDKKLLIQSLEQLRTIFNLQNETNDNLHFFLHSIGVELGYSLNSKESLKNFPNSKLKGIIKLLKEIVPHECNNPEALPYNSLFNFVQSLMHKTFSKNKIDDSNFNSLDDFYTKIIQGKSLKKLIKKLSCEELSDDFKIKRDNTVKKMEMALSSCVIN
jgi:hypothetical protein